MSAVDKKPRLSRIVEKIDWPLLFIVGLLGGVGTLNLQSAAHSMYGLSLYVTHAIWIGLGFLVVALVSLVDYRHFARWAYPIFGIVVFLLIAVALFGTEYNGSQRWLNFGFFLMQPSELLKIAVVLLFARYFHERDQQEPYGIHQLIIPLLIASAGVFLVLRQPDLGTSLVIIAIMSTVILFQGVRVSSLVIVVLCALISMPAVWTFGMRDYQKARVVAFLDTDTDRYGDSWQVRQSMIAFGSGRIAGKGHVEGTQIQKGFVPEHENDFVAANWGEERGFLGMTFLLGLYLAFLFWALRISSLARDRFGALVGVGVAAMVFWHVLVNIGMVTGLLPVVGLTLPFLSAGGSSLMTLFLGVGLLHSISVHRQR